jgi:hypothetical protein
VTMEEGIHKSRINLTLKLSWFALEISLFAHLSAFQTKPLTSLMFASNLPVPDPKVSSFTKKPRQPIHGHLGNFIGKL